MEETRNENMHHLQPRVVVILTGGHEVITYLVIYSVNFIQSFMLWIQKKS